MEINKNKIIMNKFNELNFEQFNKNMVIPTFWIQVLSILTLWIVVTVLNNGIITANIYFYQTLLLCLALSYSFVMGIYIFNLYYYLNSLIEQKISILKGAFWVVIMVFLFLLTLVNYTRVVKVYMMVISAKQSLSFYAMLFIFIGLILTLIVFIIYVIIKDYKCYICGKYKLENKPVLLEVLNYSPKICKECTILVKTHSKTASKIYNDMIDVDLNKT